MNLIVNVDKNWAIGLNGRLLFPISSDLKRFKQLTTKKIIIMGRKTFESLPGSKPLPDRINIVLSKKMEQPLAKNFFVCKSQDELFSLLHNQFAEYKPDDIFVIGGEQIYRSMLSFCSTAFVTKVLKTAPKADAFFPDLDNSTGWALSEQSEILHENGIPFLFSTYKRTNT